MTSMADSLEYRQHKQECGNTMPDLSDLRSPFIQEKLEISIYLSWDKYKESCIHILIHYYELTCCRENSVDPDQLADLVPIHLREVRNFN